MIRLTELLQHALNDKKPKVCVDRRLPKDNLFALFNAYKERPNNVLNEQLRAEIHYGGQIEQLLIDAAKTNSFDKLLMSSSPNSDMLLELAMLKSHFWEQGRTLKVKFLGGDPYVQKKIEHYAKTWETFANIKFNFIKTGTADVRISFIPGGSWSYLGIESKNINQTEPTMNFGWFDRLTSDFEFSRTVIHEFGHCLGCVHEHQSPSASIDWNKPAVYKFYMNPPNNWTIEDVDRNIFNVYDKSTITNSTFDPQSIMLYPIPIEFLSSGTPVGWNTTLSFQDTEFIRQIYPK